MWPQLRGPTAFNCSIKSTVKHQSSQIQLFQFCNDDTTRSFLLCSFSFVCVESDAMNVSGWETSLPQLEEEGGKPPAVRQERFRHTYSSLEGEPPPTWDINAPYQCFWSDCCCTQITYTVNRVAVSSLLVPELNQQLQSVCDADWKLQNELSFRWELLPLYEV